jgi:hypothetical protein
MAIEVDLLNSPDEIRDHLLSDLRSGGSGGGGGVKSISLFCTAEHDSHVLCLIDVVDLSASAAAVALNGQPFGFNSVVITMPVAQEFACRHRHPSGAVPAHCTCTPIHPTESNRFPLD